MDSNKTEPVVLIIPGYGDSGPQHWQSLWETKHPEYRRVVQQDWHFPERDEWVNMLELAVKEVNAPVILVAHSLGCITVIHWVAQQSSAVRQVKGALLVAPPDVDQPGMSLVIEGFSPVPDLLLPFPSIVVASSNDRYVTLEQAAFFAHEWGSRFINIGPAGHINADSGFGEWPAGEQLLAELT